MAKKYTIPVSLDFAALILRIGTGILILPHGWEKLQAILAGNWVFPDPLNIGSSTTLVLTFFAEFICGLAILLGLFTRPAALVLAFVMFVAGFIVQNGNPVNDRESALLFLTLSIVLLLLGPGRFSFDQRIVNKYF